MVTRAEAQSNLDGIICTRNFITPSKNIIAHQNYYFQNDLADKILDGSQFVELCIEKNINLYGNLSTLLLSTNYIKKMQLTSYAKIVPDSMRKLAFLYQLLLRAKIGYIYLPLTSTILKNYEDPTHLQKDYSDLLFTLYRKDIFRQLKPESFPSYEQSRHIICHKDVTFFYTDKSEYYNLKPIADEAEKQGYKITFTQNLDQKAEIGIYCQHVHFIQHPENSKFSVILLHDIGQGQNNWPNHWEGERWNDFDIGILPGRFWADFWSQCACQYYANPRYGVFELGYPKSDLATSDIIISRVEQLRCELRLKYDTSILYAPSWENDGKEDDFVRSLSSLKVNLLIKQAPDLEKYPVINENAHKMRTLHEGKYDNVYYIDPNENILSVLALCDLVVSDESGVMSEAIMFGKPSIAVMDWLIPDTTPSRFSCVPMDYIVKCKKSELRDHVNMLLHSPEFRKKILDKGKKVFSNAGNCCKDILNAIEYYTAPNSPKSMSFMDKKLSSKYSDCSMWN